MSARPPPEACKALLIIDQEPIRRQATAEVVALFKRLRKARRRVEDFESLDQPAFARWLSSEFQDILDEVGRLQVRVVEGESLIEEVRMIRFALGCSYHQAYVNAMERRRLGDELGDDDDVEEDESGHGLGEDLREGESRGEEGEPFTRCADEHEDERDTESDRRESKETGDEGGLFRRLRETKDDISDLGRRLKRKYRELACLLHPDLRSGGDAWTNDLWARAQAAYAARDMREIEDLLILSRVSFGNGTEEESVSDLWGAAKILKKSLLGVRRQIARLKLDMAWEFSVNPDRTRLRRRISYDLESERDELSERLEEVEAQLARWSVPPSRSSSSRSMGAGRRRRSSWDLDF